ncbi:MAG: PsbP-related protein [bacterium]|nr:PsbP-related protein [bacterium]
MKRFLNQGISPIWAVIVIVVIAILIATVFLVYGYFWSPEQPETEQPVTQDETAGWKTYKNEEYGFEIKYPDDWIFSDVNFPIINFCGLDYKTKTDCERAGINNSPVVSLRSDIIGTKDGGYCINNPSSIYCTKDLIVSDKDIKIDGEDAEMIEINSGKIAVYWRNNPFDEKMYELYASKNYPEYFDVFSKMLSTFHFLNKSKSFNDIATVGKDYLEVKNELFFYGWSLIISPDPVFEDFSDISSCGSGKDMICTVDFQNGSKKAHLNLRSKIVNGESQWIIVGTE